jgi:hypothetical protein
LLATLVGVSVHGDDRDVVINEIMYHPSNDLESLQYIELFNRGASEVNLGDWSFTKGVKFTFPKGAKIGPAGFVVVGRSTNDFFARYGREIPALGNFTGRLSHRVDHVELVNAQNHVIDSVKYSDRGDWPMAPDGHSASLERICPWVAGERPDNWIGSKLAAGQRPGGTPGRPNDNVSTNLPPSISAVVLAPPKPVPLQKTTVSATVTDSNGVKAVTLLYRVLGAGSDATEKEVAMIPATDDAKSGKYEASIEPVPEGRLVRFRFKAVDSAGAERSYPAENEPRSTLSFSTFTNTNKAQVPFGYVLHIDRPEQSQRQARNRGVPAPPRIGRPSRLAAVKGSSAFVYVAPGGGEVQTFDHVLVRPRKGGFKVHFHKDRPLNGMTAINVIFEGAPRWILAEPLAYELYRLAGVPAEQSDHIRIYTDGRYQGYYLLVEQPNKTFLTKHFKDDSGNLYKMVWYGQNIIDKHEKKTNPTTGHDDLLKLMNALNRTSGAAQWEIIQKNFNVEELANYFAVNMCIQNWDGFFNNYFTYHDIGGTGKWLIIPWDEDKTWGDYDGAALPYPWYEMPLTYGMNSDRSAGLLSRFGQGPWGGANWWRPPGPFSGPLLANPEFRKHFLARLGEICEKVFTEEKFFPVINVMEKRLIPEVQLRAQVFGESPQKSLQIFRADMQSFRDQLVNRRKFILAELRKSGRL